MVRKENSEKNGSVSSPILSKRVPQTYDIRTERRPEIGYGLVELCLLRKRSSHVHHSIIAPSGAAFRKVGTFNCYRIDTERDIRKN